jgi:hypothetical protein
MLKKGVSAESARTTSRSQSAAYAHQASQITSYLSGYSFISRTSHENHQSPFILWLRMTSWVVVRSFHVSPFTNHLSRWFPICVNSRSRAALDHTATRCLILLTSSDTRRCFLIEERRGYLFENPIVVPGAVFDTIRGL